jgi:hypothetical protein
LQRRQRPSLIVECMKVSQCSRDANSGSRRYWRSGSSSEL